jgi:hypothetical protein
MTTLLLPQPHPPSEIISLNVNQHFSHKIIICLDTLQENFQLFKKKKST